VNAYCCKWNYESRRSALSTNFYRSTVGLLTFDHSCGVTNTFHKRQRPNFETTRLECFRMCQKTEGDSLTFQTFWTLNFTLLTRPFSRRWIIGLLGFQQHNLNKHVRPRNTLTEMYAGRVACYLLVSHAARLLRLEKDGTDRRTGWTDDRKTNALRLLLDTTGIWLNV